MSLRAHQPIGLRVGGRRSRPPVLPVLLVLSLAVNAWLLLRWAPPAVPAGTSGLGQAAQELVEKLASPAASPSPTPVASVGAAADPASGAEPASPTPEPSPTPAPGSPKVGHVVIDGAVSRGFVAALGPEGERVAITASRLLNWNLDLTRDPRKGDVVDVLYRLSADGDPRITIEGLRYRSGKFDQLLEAYRFQPEGWAFPSWFDAQGQEVPGRLKGGPIDGYEEVTSLIGDGRGHAGMDFKTPVGTKVHAPFAGTVLRVNWNWRFNGNCLEIKRSDGSLIRFLHLSAVEDGIKAGVHVTAGQLVARSGNTGRSSAPHLHYEIRSASGKILDPVKVHGLTRRELPPTSRAAFEARVAEVRAAWTATPE